MGSDRNPASPATASPSRPEVRGERRLISPFRCRVWAQHSRPEEQLTEYACRSLRESIAKNGQHQPALGRPVTEDQDFDVEIICGARRHAATLSLGRDLLVEVRPMSDATAYVAMYEENVERKDDCPYIQGQILRRAMQSRTCSSQDNLARTFNLSHSKVSRLLMLAQLPSVVVAAFPSPEEIRECWGVDLYQRIKTADPTHSITNRARSLIGKNPRPRAHEVYAALIALSASDDASLTLNRRMVVRGRGGAVLFREHDQIASIAFTISKSILNPERRNALKSAMIRILDNVSTEQPSLSADRRGRISIRRNRPQD